MKWLKFTALFALAGCIKAPDVVIVDRHSLLEEQAAARMPAAEAQVAQAGLSPGPLPLTPGELTRSGWHTDAAHDAIAALYSGWIDDAQMLDQLLTRHCIGEANDGTLISTPGACAGATDLADVGRRLEKANRSRRQIWLYVQEQRPQATELEVRAQWRQTRQKGLVCGGWWQKDDQGWEAKTCQ